MEALDLAFLVEVGLRVVLVIVPLVLVVYNITTIDMKTAPKIIVILSNPNFTIHFMNFKPRIKQSCSPYPKDRLLESFLRPIHLWDQEHPHQD